MSTTTRLSEKSIETLKFLKKELKAKSYEKVIEKLANEHLRNNYAISNSGYFSVGAVVYLEGKTVVIEEVDKVKVKFNNGSEIFNGSLACLNMKKLADSVKEYKGVIEC
jgi:hypothetical protein